jgi:hypothetical protein
VNEGCNGGDMGLAFDYIRDNNIDYESSYPYTARDGTCKYNKGDGKGKISRGNNVKPNDLD